MLQGEGKWNGEEYQFFDGDKGDELRSAEPQPLHFRSSNLQDVYKRQAMSWETILSEGVQVPTPELYVRPATSVHTSFSTTTTCEDEQRDQDSLQTPREATDPREEPREEEAIDPTEETINLTEPSDPREEPIELSEPREATREIEITYLHPSNTFHITHFKQNMQLV